MVSKISWKRNRILTIYGFELLFPKDVSKDVQETIEKFLAAPPSPELLKESVRLHQARLRYIPIIEVSAIKGKCSKKIFKYLKSRVVVKQGRSLFDGFRDNHYFWPANVFELDEVKAELELLKSGLFLRLENEEDVKLVKKTGLWRHGRINMEYKYKDALKRMSGKEKNRAIWETIMSEFVKRNALAYEKILEAYRELGKLFWFTFYNPIF